MKVPRPNYSKNLYDILGLSPNCTKQEIKSQFYKLSLLYHPDRRLQDQSIDKNAKSVTAETKSSNGGEYDAHWYHERFIQISQAYSILSNDLQRAEYDSSIGHNQQTTTIFPSRHSKPMDARNQWGRPIWDPFPGYRHTTDRHGQASGNINYEYYSFRHRTSTTKTKTPFMAYPHAESDRSDGELRRIREVQQQSSHEQLEARSLYRRRILLVVVVATIYLLTGEQHPP